VVPILAAEYTITYSRPFLWSMLFIGLAWGVWVVLNLWIWQKTKATANLIMLIASGVLAVSYVVRSFAAGPDVIIDVLAVIALTAGFFMSVRPMVEAHLAKLKDKLPHGGGSSNPS
jgi:hypothetical protein